MGALQLRAHFRPFRPRLASRIPQWIPQCCRLPFPAHRPRRSNHREEMAVSVERSCRVPQESLHDLDVSACTDRQ